mmetsp:Transcript_97592/g.304370  ORF Transcript_97592/g.304370 Transcript_97592/m.304370 type:complete len:206 (+) Transcript_97592:166-783(+)
MQARFARSRRPRAALRSATATAASARTVNASAWRGESAPPRTCLTNEAHCRKATAAAARLPTARCASAAARAAQAASQWRAGAGPSTALPGCRAAWSATALAPCASRGGPSCASLASQRASTSASSAAGGAGAPQAVHGTQFWAAGPGSSAGNGTRVPQRHTGQRMPRAASGALHRAQLQMKCQGPRSSARWRQAVGLRRSSPER